MSLTVRVLNLASFRVEGQRRQVNFRNVFKVWALLQFGQLAQILLLQCLFTYELGEKSDVELNHFEVDELLFLEFPVNLLELGDLLADLGPVVDQAVDHRLRSRQLFVEEVVVVGTVINQVVEGFRNRGFVGLVALNRQLRIFRRHLDAVYYEILVDCQPLICQSR